jgi:hypothetical protein
MRKTLIQKMLKRYKGSTIIDYPRGSHNGKITKAMFERGYQRTLYRMTNYEIGGDAGDLDLRVSFQSKTQEVQFSFNIELPEYDNYRDTMRFKFSGVSIDDQKKIKKKYKPFMSAKPIPVSNTIIETSNPLVTLTSLKDLSGNAIQGGIIDDLLIQHLAGNAPLINDILRFYNKYKRTDRVQEVKTADGETEQYTIFPNSLVELTGISGGRDFIRLKKELESLRVNTPRIMLRTKLKGRGFSRKAPRLQTGLILSYTLNTKPLKIALSPILISLDGGFKKMPANLREKWDQWAPRKRKSYHELAFFWAYQLPATPDKRSLTILKKHWGIADDKKDPKRTMQRVESCIDFLKTADLLLSHKIDDDDDFYFYMNKHEFPDIIESKKIGMGVFSDDE